MSEKVDESMRDGVVALSHGRMLAGLLPGATSMSTDVWVYIQGDATPEQMETAVREIVGGVDVVTRKLIKGGYSYTVEFGSSEVVVVQGVR